MKPQNIGLPSGCKIYINKVYVNTINFCGANVNCCRLVAVFNRFG